MPPIDRNAPCPCGSGTKYKRCCLRKDDEAAHPPPDPLVLAMKELGTAILRFTTRDIGITVDQLASAIPGELLDEHSLPFWIEMLIFHAPSPGQPIAAAYLQRPLPAAQATLCANRMSAWPAVFEVLEVHRGTGVRAVDHLTGEVFDIRDALLSKGISPLTYFVGLVFETGGTWRLSITHPLALPADEATATLRDIRRILKLRGKKLMTREQLRDWETMLKVTLTWSAHALSTAMPEEPRLQNTDGDPSVMVHDHYRIAEGRHAELLARSQAIEGAVQPQRTPEGTVIAFLRDGNPMHASWDNTVIGQLMARDVEHVELVTNSVRRADDLRARFEAACGDLVTHRGRELKDPWSALEQSRKKRGPPR